MAGRRRRIENGAAPAAAASSEPVIVAAFVEERVFKRGTCAGLSCYASRPGRNWLILIGRPKMASEFDPREIGVSGVLAHLSSQAIVQAAEKWRCPVVNLSSALDDYRFASVCIANEPLGRMAARALLTDV